MKSHILAVAVVCLLKRKILFRLKSPTEEKTIILVEKCRNPISLQYVQQPYTVGREVDTSIFHHSCFFPMINNFNLSLNHGKKEARQRAYMSTHTHTHTICVCEQVCVYVRRYRQVYIICMNLCSIYVYMYVCICIYYQCRQRLQV